ncbi:MAG: amidohydrolase family protein [Acidimicrobiia bacterium]
MIIDAHSHLVAPPAFYQPWVQMAASGVHNGRIRPPVSDDELIAAADRQIGLMDAVGTDVQFTSPRPYVLNHSHRSGQIIHWWVENNNDAIAAQVRARPGRIQGVGALPQVAGQPVTVVFDELDRCLDELGMIGVLVNPDPGEGDGLTPTMGDEYWYPLYEKLVDRDVPVLLHSASCHGRENYSQHFISEESLAIGSILEGEVFSNFPTLKLIVPHGGGSVPYQMGRWIAHKARLQGLPAAEATGAYRTELRRFWFDTCLYTTEALELLFRAVGADRVLFGTERPGSGGILEDLKPVIEKLDVLDEDDRAAVFEGNARSLYTRFAPPGAT